MQRQQADLRQGLVTVLTTTVTRWTKPTGSIRSMQIPLAQGLFSNHGNPNMDRLGQHQTGEASSQLRRVLRCKATGRYYTGAGWSDAQTQAKTFESSAEAVRVAVACHLANIEVVVQRSDQNSDVICVSIR